MTYLLPTVVRYVVRYLCLYLLFPILNHFNWHHVLQNSSKVERKVALLILAKIISILYQFSGEGGDCRGDQNILVLSRKWVLCIVIIVLMLFQGMPF